MSEAVFFCIYRWLIWPMLKAAFQILARFSPKIAKGLELRERVNGRAPWIKLLPPSPPTVWIHAASGEFEYAKPVITKLKSLAPQTKVVVTYFSPTYADNARKFSGVDWVVPLPWDSPNDLHAFMDSYRPAVLLIARTDVWPEMARQARRRNFKSILFSANLSSRSGRTRGIGRWATRSTLNQLDEISCATEDDAAEFRKLGLTRPSITVDGDTRYDQVLARLQSPKPVREDIFSAIGARPIFVCGSTWAEDEAVLVPALRQLGKDVVGCLVPHEPTPSHLAELEALVTSHGLTPVRYSDPEASTKVRESATPCLIVDQIGLLAELYLKARIAFVGGSFKKTVHSVMEPLAAGCFVLVGPMHTNNREALLFKTQSLAPNLTMVSEIQTSQQIAETFRNLIQLPGEAKTKVRSLVESKTAASEKLARQILTSLS